MAKEGKKKELSFIKKHSTLSIILIYNFVTVIIGFLFYYLLPILMGYPPTVIQVSIKLGTSIPMQYIVIMSAAIVFGTLFFIIILRGFDNWRKVSVDDQDHDSIFKKIRIKCINLPYIIYILQITLVNLPLAIGMITVALINNMPIIVVLKIITIIFSFFTLAALISHTFSKRIFTGILLETYKGEELQGIRISLRSKIFMQIIPIAIVSILFMGTLGYARLMEEKGNMVYKICKEQLLQDIKTIKEIKDINQIFKAMNNIEVDGTKISHFVITPKGEFISSDGYKPSAFFLEYSRNPYKVDRVYGDTNEIQGVITILHSSTGDYKIGTKFEMGSNTTSNFFIGAFFGLLLIIIFVLYYLSKTLTSEISLVAENLNEIAEGESVNIDKKLAVTSNDEIADLVIAFNKIQEREKEHIHEIEESQTILMEQERLASLGHLIGGIAHNLRTPLMSLSGGIEGLKDLIKEYDDAIDDIEVDKSDHHEIAKDMSVWIEKMRPYCSYMDDIITAVKGQTTQYQDTTGVGFTLDEVGKRVEILIEHELRRRYCKLNVDFEADRNTRIYGEISVLVQILNNLIVNAAESYLGNGGDIELTVLKNDKEIEFIIKDFGCGMNAEVQKKLFKEMITTKGNKGTGLGLYMSYSNLKARFGGSMRFESEDGKGTTFYINIPYK